MYALTTECPLSAQVLNVRKQIMQHQEDALRARDEESIINGGGPRKGAGLQLQTGVTNMITDFETVLAHG